jgi:hypothetical protein
LKALDIVFTHIYTTDLQIGRECGTWKMKCPVYTTNQSFKNISPHQNISSNFFLARDQLQQIKRKDAWEKRQDGDKELNCVKEITVELSQTFFLSAALIVMVRVKIQMINRLWNEKSLLPALTQKHAKRQIDCF